MKPSSDPTSARTIFLGLTNPPLVSKGRTFGMAAFAI